MTRNVRELIDPKGWVEVVIRKYAVEYIKPNGNKGYKDTTDIDEATRYKKSPKKMMYNKKLIQSGGYEAIEIEGE